MHRITKHPILKVQDRNDVTCYFNDRKIAAKDGEMISSALFANGIQIFGHHHRDGAAQGIFCANGQCSQCLVIANGKPLKACMTPVAEGMRIQSCDAKPLLPHEDTLPAMDPIPTIDIECLVIGGGPAGLSAALEMAQAGIRTIVVDDKFELGGKLTLQTHKFFGSIKDCYAGTRGVDIAKLLEEKLSKYTGDLVDIWPDSPAIGVYGDGLVGVVKRGRYVLVKPRALLVAAGAREKVLAFPGCDLPGIYGAGAFQTLVNRDLVKPTGRLFICGGGNVGLIAGYHALQAGVEVVGLVEALSYCGGYKVHLDKLRRFGVPVYTSHTILRAEGGDALESVTICSVDKAFNPIHGAEKTFMVDTLLIAVGLSSLNDLYKKAKEYGMKAYIAGDAEEIAEASAAMFSGRINGRRIIRDLKGGVEIPKEWDALFGILKSKPGDTKKVRVAALSSKVYPVIRCVQEIPCNPCTEACPKVAIKKENNALTGLPHFEGDECTGCAKCVLACPGLAIALVDERYDTEGASALVTIPFELNEDTVKNGDEVFTVGLEGEAVGKAKIVKIRRPAAGDRCALVYLEVPFEQRLEVAAIKLQKEQESMPAKATVQDNDTIICRCERITKSEIVRCIRGGYRDMNQIKAALRTGMGACGGKSCGDLILRLFQQEGVALSEVTPPIYRPIEREVPLGVLAGVK